MKTFTILILTMIFMAMTTFAQTTPPIEAGVSQTLAKWRTANYSDVRYKLNITLEKGAPLMTGDIEISVTLSDEGAKNDLVLDWRTTQFAADKDKPFADVVSVNQTVMGKATQSNAYDYQTTKEHLLISHRFFKTGENNIEIKFASPIKTSGAAITRYVDKEDGAEYVYSLFVPSDANTAFPVFDQPDLKARFSLTTKFPWKWKAISNTNTSGNCFAIDPGAPITCRFEETQPISTYVFAFAAGEFAEFEDEYYKDNPFSRLTTVVGKATFKFNVPKIYVRKSQAEKFKQHAAEVFRLNREGVKFLESWFDYKFPFPKYDLVLIPEFPFGGMEHAGATFLREDRVIFPTEPTKNDYVTRANVIFHEAAHQWFGDTVTMRWFDDLWLKEGFAEFMAYKTLEKVMPEYNAWKIFYERNKQAAYLTDSTRGTTPIYQEIENLSAAKSAYGNIVYRKAPSFLRQAEFYLGEDKFQTAVRQFLKKHEFANAEWTDLVKEFELASKQDLKDWANVWVKQRGLAIVRATDGCSFNKSFETILCRMAKGRKNVYEISQKGALAENDVWQMNLNVLYHFPDKPSRVEKIKIGNIVKATTNDNNSKSEQITDVIGQSKESFPDFIFPNYQDYGYGIFLLDEKSRAYVLANIQTEKDDFLRTMMWGALWDSVRETELNPKDYVELVIKNINVESDESTIQTILGRVSTAMNYYLSNKQRDELAPQLETLLLRRILDTKTIGQKITFFRAFLNIASSKQSQITLKRFLESGGKTVALETIGDVNALMLAIELPALKTKDKFDIVTKLLILGDKDAPQLLAKLEKSEQSDEAKRYAYAARAGIGTKEAKEKYFNDFLNNKEISESYIESAILPFNSPRHSALTLPYLEKALAELPNLKKNRKIFFVNGWLAAFIGGQKSEQALAIVNKFLADNPNLDKDLRLKILENADGLERAVKIRAKYEK